MAYFPLSHHHGLDGADETKPTFLFLIFFFPPCQVMEREARNEQSAAVRLTLRREVLVNEGLGGPQAKGARVRDNFDPTLYNPRANTASTLVNTAIMKATARERAEARAQVEALPY